MNQYRVHPFHLHVAGGSSVLITAHSVVRLTDEAFGRMLGRLQQDQDVLLTDTMLEQRAAEHDLPCEATRDYLLARGVLQRLGNARERISGVHIVSADEGWRDMLLAHLGDLHPTVSARDMQERPHTADVSGYQLWVLLLPSYSRVRVEAFYEQLRQVPAASGLIAHHGSGTLHVSSVYSPAYRTPCHFCHVGWDNHTNTAQGATSASMFALMRRFEAMGEQELPISPLQGLDQAVACAFLVQHIRQLAGVASTRLLQEAITTRHEFDLQSFDHRRHIAVHWPGCDCQYLDTAEVAPA